MDEYGAYEEWAVPEPILHSFGPTRYSSNINDGTGVLEQAEFGDGDANGEAKPVGDLNGDGRDDMLYLRASPNGAIPYYSDGDGTFTAGATISGLYSDAYIFPGDFNGDGCMDLLAQGSSSKIYFSCNAPVSSVSITNWVPNQYKLVLGDYNGDGNTDVLTARDGYYSKIHLSDGTSLVEMSYQGPTDWVKYRVQSGDFNGDMLADLMLVAFDSTGGNYGPTTTHKIYLSTGEGFSYETAISNPAGTFHFLRVHDFNGDGVVDYWIKKVDATNENKLHVTDYDPMMISAISDGLGQTTSIEYDRLNNNTATYTKGSSATYPDMDVIGAQYVVKEVDVPNGVGSTNTFAYKYEGARYNQQGRLLLGFKKQIVTDPNGIVQTTTFKQDYPYIGKVESVTQVKSGVTLSSITNTYQNTTPTPAGTGGQRRYVKLYQTVEATKDLNGATFPTITTTYTYDSYGNPLTVVVSGTGGDTKTTTNTYTNNTTSWLLGRLLTTQTVHALTGSTSITRQASFQYNSTTGLLTQEVIEPNNASLKLTTDYTRDAYGNITQISVSGTGVTTRTTTNTFDSKKRFVATTTNPESHVEQYQYDAAFGTVTSFTDPNSLVSTFLYDGFGRVTKETDPDGRYRDITYTYCSGVASGSASCTTNGAMQILSTPKRSGGSTQSGPIEAVVLDKLGRQIAEGAEAFNGTDWSLAETIYDSLGTVQKVTRPYLTSGSATQYTTFVYDALGRPTSSSTYPDSRTDEFTYNGKITTHTKDKYGLNQTTTTEFNDQGLIKKVTEPGSIITQYTYYPTGDLKVTTDPASNTITLTVDTRGRITQRVDPSLGTWTYQYNRFDELTQQTDAKSQVTTYAYDKLGRLTVLTASGLTSTFTYDT
ncbi:MAG: VCBS repeat-containing protein, partial [Caldilineaceae bacterium]|nr:VCBS repeat-containing protein [Caldilineaceae bacterium]